MCEGLAINTDCFIWLRWLVCICEQNPALESSVASFEEFGLHKQLLNGLAEMKYETPTAIQVLL